MSYFPFGAETDAVSTTIIASTAFTAGTWIWSSAVNMTKYTDIAFWFMPTVLGSNTEVLIAAKWSDDGSTIDVSGDKGFQQTDFLLTNNVDGSFLSKNYQPKLTTAEGSLVANLWVPYKLPVGGGRVYIGVKGNHASGAFSVRAQRVVA